MVFVKYLYRYVRRQARIYSFRLNYTLLLLSGAHRRGQGLRERPGAEMSVQAFSGYIARPLAGVGLQ